MDNYITILGEGRFEYEDRKSVFYGFSSPVKTENEALDFIAKIKKSYPDARHHVYAYALKEGNLSRFSDDREPQGTAGIPVLDAIRKNNCTDTAIVVVRYFGGILLGTGGLVRAYSSAASGALKAGQIVKYSTYSSYIIKASYSDYQKIIPIMQQHNFRILDNSFLDIVKIEGNILSSDKESFIAKIDETTSARADIEFAGEELDF